MKRWGAAALLLAACTPEFDWREVRPEGVDLVAMFPCRPGRLERDVELAGRPVRLALLSCRAGDALFAMAHADIGDADRIAPALDELRASVVRNIDGTETERRPYLVRGMTPSAQAVQAQVRGRRPDGSAVEGEVAVFSIGPRVVQLQVLASRLDAEAARAFLTGLQIRR